MPKKPITKVNEGSSCLLTFTLDDYFDVGIASTAVTTATMTLKDRDTGSVINSLTAVDVSGGFDATGGGFEWELVAADNPIVTDDKSEETHIASITITSDAGGYTITLQEEVNFVIKELKHIT